jgi:antitoxin (DNA-binding transcriptional repressor) of toxin-antitoxin stability system
MKELLRALDRGETVTLLYRGRERALLSPTHHRPNVRVEDHAAFGMWAGREDMRDVRAFVRSLRRSRARDL